MQLDGKVALVTGGGSGIGAATAELFAEQGAKVAVLGRTEDELKEVVDRIRKKGGDAISTLADVSKADEVRRAVDETAGHYKRLDVVFANAGVNGVWAPIEELEPEEWEKTIRINLMGTFLTVKYAVPHLKVRGGSVIVTSSVNGTRIFSNTGASAYSSSKAGQVAFTKMIALELAKHRVRVNVICPGAISTEIEENMEKRDVEREKEPVEFPEG